MRAVANDEPTETRLRVMSERPPFVDLRVGPGLEPDNRRFGELLERLRKHAGLSRADAASRLGFSSEYLRLIEAGKRTPALGQMRSFLDTYGADGEVEGLMPGGDRPDLVVIDPHDLEPVIVEFKSRIREARRSEPEDRNSMFDKEWSFGDSEYDSGPSPDRAVELGLVVSLLTRADIGTLRTVRELLEVEVGSRLHSADS